MRDGPLVRIDFKFDQIEDIIDGRLPDRALKDENWWRGRRRLWASTGFRVTQVHLPQRVVRFRQEVDAPRRRAILAYVAVGAGTLLLCALILWLLPGTLVDPGLKLTGQSLAEVRNDARTTLITLLLALGAGGSLAFTARTYLLSRQSHITDRFTQTITQLGSTSLAVRLGALHALGRITTDSPRDAKAIMSILCQFVKDESRRASALSRRSGLRGLIDPASGLRGPVLRADIATAFNLAIELAEDLGPLSLQLNASRLDGINFSGASCPEPALDGTSLRYAYLEAAHFPQAWIRYADLRDAWLSSARLREASFDGSRLDRADLSYADLEGADFSRADMTGTILKNANLKGANLRTARGLTHRQLAQAVVDEHTRLPATLARHPPRWFTGQARVRSRTR
ncbi:pentapeptide repeat-containing protein [Nonomuraea guangzhouensis]|nr:pentapeptide repeat-containing protein [Nonomuraea guangzhouensis]